MLAYSTHLIENGIRVTRPRLKILELFYSIADAQRTHLTAEDVHEALKERGIVVGLATVYRILSQFEEVGLLTKHHFELNKAVFELTKQEHHDHLICVKCGYIKEFFSASLESMQDRIAHDFGFSIQDHRLFLYGVCQTCQTT